MRNLLLCLSICMLLTSFAYAQDPGEQDSIIIHTAWRMPPISEIYVWVWMRTDDSIAYYNMPLQFTASGTGITFSRIDYFPPLLNWDDTFFDYIEGDEFLRHFGFMDIDSNWNPPLFTNYERLHVFNLVFDIDANATYPQHVLIDFYDDPINGPTILGGVDGMIQIEPALVPGAIYYEPFLNVEDDDILPTETGLAQNYPNPFNPTTNIEFALVSDQVVRIDVYNILGQHIQTIADGSYPAGNHTVSWNGSNANGETVPSGVYFYNMVSEDFSQTNKMMLLR